MAVFNASSEWLSQTTYTLPPTTVTSSSTTGVYLGPFPAVAPAPPQPDGPLEWLARRVNEVCDLALATP